MPVEDHILEGAALRMSLMPSGFSGYSASVLDGLGSSSIPTRRASSISGPPRHRGQSIRSGWDLVHLPVRLAPVPHRTLHISLRPHLRVKRRSGDREMEIA